MIQTSSSSSAEILVTLPGLSVKTAKQTARKRILPTMKRSQEVYKTKEQRARRRRIS